MTATKLTHSKVMALAIPVMLSQVAIASTGVVDTLVMGIYGGKTDLAAVGVAAVVMNFLYWAFGFLRMSTTGLTAQAAGAGENVEVSAVLQRALISGAAIGMIILVLSPVLKLFVFQPFAAEQEVKDLAKSYWDARIWGAPALLIGFGISGWLLGTGKTRELLALQIVMNLFNAGLDAWFVAELKMGPAGIGTGTAIAEWCAAVFGFYLVRRELKRIPAVLERSKLVALFNANRDVLIRTLALLTAFAWFVNSGAQLGTATLAGNELLLQFVTISAFILDGFAFVAEKEVGEAYGARSRQKLLQAMRITTELAFFFSILITLIYFFGGAIALEAFVKDEEARQIALAYLPYCAFVPLIGFLSWQLDGFFLGATQGKALRNGALLFCIAYLATDSILRPIFGNTGVWTAFLAMYLYRIIGLGIFLPGLIRETAHAKTHS